MADNLITLVNNSLDLNTSLALFQQANPNPSGQITAWQVVYLEGTENNSHLGGQSQTPVPDDYAMVLNYMSGISSIMSSPVSWTGYGANVDITTDVNPIGDLVLDLDVLAASDPTRVIINVPPNIGPGVTATVTKNMQNVLPPIALFASGTAGVQIVPTFYVGVVSQTLQSGSPVNAAEISATQAIQPGQTATVTGSAAAGYTITVAGTAS